MLDIKFISKLYNNKNSYADVFTNKEIEALNIETNIEETVSDFIRQGKLVLITGNPGDGKTHLILSVKDVLKEFDAFIEKDINEVKNYDSFLKELQNCIDEGRPGIIAINEYPLVALLDQIGVHFPFYEEIKKQRENSLIYNNDYQEETDISRVVVIDLNNRNVLSKDIVSSALNKLLSYCDLSGEDTNNTFCDLTYNTRALSNEYVKKQLLTLVDILGNSGVHVVMRDILGFLSYVLTGGKDFVSEITHENMYYNRIFNGKNRLFYSLKKFDPFNFTHPEIDELLWTGRLKDGWIFSEPSVSPEELNEVEAKELFISLKRKFFFEHERGTELLSLIPSEYKDYFYLIRQVYDQHEEMVNKVTLGLNRFFNSNDNEEEKLRVWITHKYELRSHPKVAISNKSYPTEMISLRIPGLPKHLEKIPYAADHFVYRVKSLQNLNNFVDLKIDLDLYKALSLINEGFPTLLIPEQHKFKIYRFMNELASLEGKTRSNNFIIKDATSGYSFNVSIRNNKYATK